MLRKWLGLRNDLEYQAMEMAVMASILQNKASRASLSGLLKGHEREARAS